ncbi:hypothetical protein ACIGO8_04995 [Streptomyces sp. NPDC053493]|uniref:hypothetical protein n=1 Tax=Streptomyces sp. NPDC053493 TaxID=3365705 RepID=UPI0037D379D7
MSMSGWKRAGVALTVAAVVGGVAGCDGGDAKKAAEAPAKAVSDGLGDVTKALTAAFEKTSAAKSVKVSMTIEMTGAGAQSGTTTLSGVQSWDPAAMDVTMGGPMLGGAGGAGAGNKAGLPGKIRMVMLDKVMYMDMGDKLASEFDGKHWMKMDLGAMAKMSGDPALGSQADKSLDNMNQDPAQQLALLLKSPNLKHVGAEKIGGTDAEHYKGTLTFEDMLKSNKAYDDAVPEKDRKALLDNVRKAGIKGYDTEIWVNSDGYPVRMLLGMKMPMGSMKMTANYTDYGTKVAVQAPPAKDTLDFAQLMKDLGAGAPASGGAGTAGATAGSAGL